MAADPLAKACELAFEVARQGVETDPPVDPPAPMRSFLYVAQLPPRAVSVAQRVVDTDDHFRDRVAAQATEAGVGKAGYLWLSRPDGWQASYSSLTGSVAPTAGAPAAASPAVPPPPPAPEGIRPAPVPAEKRPAPPVVPDLDTAARGNPVSDPFAASRSASPSTPTDSAASETGSGDLETELSSLRNLVDQLAEERENVVAPIAASAISAPATSEPGRPSAPASPPAVPAAAAPVAPAVEPSSLSRQLNALTADLRRARTERDDALTEKETSIARQLILEEELNTVRVETGGVANRLTELEADRSSLELSLSESQTTISELETKLASLETKLASLETEGTEAQARIDNLLRERDGAAQDHASVVAERDEQVARVQVAEQARVDLEAELTDVSAKWQDAQVELVAVAERRASVETEVADLLEARAQETHERSAMMSSMATNVSDLETERDLLGTRLESAQRHLAATRTVVDQANAAIGTELGLTESALADLARSSDALGAAVSSTSDGLALEAPSEPALAEVADEPAIEVPSGSTPTIPVAPVLPIAATKPPAGDVAASDESADTDDLADADVGSDVDVDVDVDVGSDVDVAESDGDLEKTLDTVDTVDTVDTADTADTAEQNATSVSNEPDTIPVLPQAGFEADRSPTETGGAKTGDADAGTVDEVVGSGVPRQQVPSMVGDPVAVARHTVSTADVVVLIHGDPVATLGWPTLDVAARRDALVSYLGDLAAETGAAPDVVFDGRDGDESALPTSRVVRVRLTNADVDAEEAIAPLVNSYPTQWPVAVVTDSASLAETVKAMGASVVENGHMLDLFIAS